MSELKIEVGKSYVTRDGKTVNITLHDAEDEVYSFASDTEWYTASGLVWANAAEDDGDLIREVPTSSGADRRREVLAEVERCVCRDRQNTYGDAEDNFADIAALATICMGRKLNSPLTAEDVAIFSCCIKLARLKASPSHADNWVDLAGYATCGGGIVAGRAVADAV